jgi:hypothetical protein
MTTARRKAAKPIRVTSTLIANPDRGAAGIRIDVGGAVDVTMEPRWGTLVATLNWGAYGERTVEQTQAFTARLLLALNYARDLNHGTVSAEQTHKKIATRGKR